MADKQFNRVNLALQRYGSILVAKYKEKLLEDKTYASGATSDSVKATLGDEMLTMSFDKTMEYIDSGTRPAKGKVPMNGILAWMKAKGIRARDQKTGKYIKQERGAYAIAKHIEKNGTIKRYMYNGSSILSRVYNEIADKLGQDIIEAWHKDVMDNLDRATPNAKKN